jgi:voltage-gated potassium channel
MPRSSPAIPADPWRRVRVGLAILGLVMTVGVIGYRILGLDFFDAFYQTAVTVTTVGFEEIGPEEEIDRAYRTFTLLLVFFGVSGALYTLSVMVEAVVEGSINDGFRLRRDYRMIQHMSDHVILAGAGRVGRAISHYVGRHDADLVIIDRAYRPDGDQPVILAEATEDETLIQAGVERAHTLIAALDSDADNLYVTLSARALNADLFIVARTNSQANEAKFYQAGADRVVNPHEIGGSRMGALALHPSLAEFLDEVLHDESHGVRIAEVALPESSTAIGAPLGLLLDRCNHSPLVLAVRNQQHGYDVNPSSDTSMHTGDVLVVLGHPEEVDDLRRATL